MAPRDIQRSEDTTDQLKTPGKLVRPKKGIAYRLTAVKPTSSKKRKASVSNSSTPQQSASVPSDISGDDTFAAAGILKEQNNLFRIRWVGIDPATGEAWPDNDVSDGLSASSAN